MAKISKPVLFSKYYKVRPTTLKSLGIFNPTLNADTPLFIDPMLLSGSAHPEMIEASKRYRQYFQSLVSLVSKMKSKNDVAWRAADRKLSFPEFSETCLGYGGDSIRGAGFGPKKRTTLLKTAKEVIELGVDDPMLFPALSLFEEGVGPDLISDMTARIILPELAAFNQRMAEILSLPFKIYDYRNAGQYSLIPNPYENNKPVILVPRDILRDLPIAADWEDVMDAAKHNQDLRDRINSEISDLWKRKVQRDKRKVKDFAMQKKDSFQILLDALYNAEPEPYDLEKDPAGVVRWRDLLWIVNQEHPLTLKVSDSPSLEDWDNLVRKIIQKFKDLVESGWLTSELYNDGKPKNEDAAQKLFYAVAEAYCDANNLDVTPEAETGRGPVDFKFSKGYRARILVEVKLSTNSKLLRGYESQLGTYIDSGNAHRGHYMVIDVGKMGRKGERLLQKKNTAAKSRKNAPEVHFIEGTQKPSASKL